MTETKTHNLYQKLLSITEEIGKIEKTGTNAQQGYKFIEQAFVVAEVRVQLAKHGVMIIPQTVERQMEQFTNAKGTTMFHAKIKSTYTLVNTDDPKETILCEWDAGEALDSSDKATNKATTASHKSFLMKLFNISDKDDPDTNSPTVVKKVEDTPLVKLQAKARTTMAAHDIRGDKAKGFLELTIGKEKPETAEDFEQIIKALEV